MFVDFLTQARRKVVRDGGISLGGMQELGIPDAFVPRLSTRLLRDTNFVKACSFTSQGRRLNNFNLGSDPEFAFFDSQNDRKVHAVSLGMRPALAAGCDQNQRLAELRCWPSTSAVEHVAGILASLRWMYRIYPSTRQYRWVAGAWCDNDGIGGHVHFGRKRPGRELEVAGLDGLATAFRQLEFFCNADWDRRIAGDSIGQHYGGLGDIRRQLHGYEYRTLPSWLCSPQKAFTVISASKLVVLDPDLTRGWIEAPPETALDRLKGLAAYFSGRDDDAWLLKHLLSRVPLSYLTQQATDFKLNWGFQGYPEVTSLSSSILAACVQPTASEIEEIKSFLFLDTALGFVESAPTFKNTIPEHYYWAFQKPLSGINRSGFGDLMHNLVMHKDYPVSINYGDSFVISGGAPTLWTAAQKALAKKSFPQLRLSGYGLSCFTISITREMTLVDQIKQLKDFLLKSGLFPVWTVDTVKADSYKTWITQQKSSQIKVSVKERTV